MNDDIGENVAKTIASLKDAALRLTKSPAALAVVGVGVLVLVVALF